MSASACICELMTPGGVGAVAIIQLIGDVERGLRSVGLEPLEVGAVALRDLCGVDTGLVIRWSESCAQITPHGGRATTFALMNRLADAGVEVGSAERAALRSRWPEAEDDIEAMMLDALARARSPLAIDLLLDQPRRWRAWNGAEPHPNEVRRVSSILNRLITPPTVVAVGRPNVGKSTLVNALARRSVSIVVDEPGATRDHVGVTLELDGLAVRWIDTPGIRPTPANEPEAQARESSDAIEREAAALAREVAASADLLIICVDATEGGVEPVEVGARPGQELMRIGTRADLGETPGAEIATAAATGDGLQELIGAVRERLAPAAGLGWPGPWAFDERLIASSGKATALRHDAG